jgi:molybdopterin-guanine dinucleotide biosynthesis protein A
MQAKRMHPRDAAISGLVLAGGRGSRMGHTDKGLQDFHGKPMINAVLDRFAPQVGKLLISANRNLPLYRQFGIPVWPDDMPDYAGPLAGLQTGLQHCDTPYLASVPCDSPFLPLDLVDKLHDALIAANADLAVAVTGVGALRRQQPVFCLMKTALLPHLTQFLQQGGRKVDAWYASCKTVETPFRDESAFRNINTLEELKRCEANVEANIK